ncbi:mannosyl-oligosaccharide alpha-1,2-mannosidase 1B [Elaphomyces granulatus]
MRPRERRDATKSSGRSHRNADVVNEIVSLIPAINFISSSPGTIGLFETTIRYLGGLLAGEPRSEPRRGETILAQTQSLADSLKYAFNTPTGIPYNNPDLNSKSHDNAQTNWRQKAESYLLNPQPAWTPGLVGANVAIETGLFQDNYVGWIAGDDSFYEYLIKM